MLITPSGTGKGVGTGVGLGVGVEVLLGDGARVGDEALPSGVAVSVAAVEGSSGVGMLSAGAPPPQAARMLPTSTTRDVTSKCLFIHSCQAQSLLFLTQACQNYTIPIWPAQRTATPRCAAPSLCPIGTLSTLQAGNASSHARLKHEETPGLTPEAGCPSVNGCQPFAQKRQGQH
jgi:hypothetical protein